MAAVADALLIFAAQYKRAETLLELCSCNDEAVDRQPALHSAILCRDMGDDAVSKQELLNIS